MSNNAGNGTGRTQHYAMMGCCVKQSLVLTGSTQGVYKQIASLLRRIVYVYREKKFIYLAMNHSSNFLLHPFALVSCLRHISLYNTKYAIKIMGGWDRGKNGRCKLTHDSTLPDLSKTFCFQGNFSEDVASYAVNLSQLFFSLLRTCFGFWNNSR
jgi:hypothetical protein